MNHPLGNPTINFPKPTLILGNKNYSSWSLRGWLILHTFGVEFDEMPIKLFHPSNAEILTNYTPTNKVPVLLHNDNTVWDSLAIALYAEKYLISQNIWGNHPAIAMSLISEMHSGFVGLRGEMPMNIRAKRNITPSPALPICNALNRLSLSVISVLGMTVIYWGSLVWRTYFLPRLFSA